MQQNKKMNNRTIYGLATSKELHMSNEDLHELVQKLTGKGHISKLNERETAMVAYELMRLKDSTMRQNRKADHPSTGGNQATINQRKKIYRLTEDLGWKEKSRVNGMCRKMFGVETVEWLNYMQCSKLIEALKSMAGRERVKEGGTNGEA